MSGSSATLRVSQHGSLTFPAGLAAPKSTASRARAAGACSRACRWAPARRPLAERVRTVDHAAVIRSPRGSACCRMVSKSSSLFNYRSSACATAQPANHLVHEIHSTRIRNTSTHAHIHTHHVDARTPTHAQLTHLHAHVHTHTRRTHTYTRTPLTHHLTQRARILNDNSTNQSLRSDTCGLVTLHHCWKLIEYIGLWQVGHSF